MKSCKLNSKHGEETCDANHPIRRCVILKASLGNHYGKKAADDKFAAYSNHFDFSYISVLNI